MSDVYPFVYMAQTIGFVEKLKIENHYQQYIQDLQIRDFCHELLYNFRERPLLKMQIDR